MSTSVLQRFNSSHWKRILIFWGVVLVVLLIIFLVTWNIFFTYVPPGKHLVIIAKQGDSLPPGHVLARPGQQGPLEEVLGEGWHFVLPIVYEARVMDNTIIPADKVGLVTAKGGDPLPAGQFLAERGQQGIQREVLTPGAYRINKIGFDVTPIDVTHIKPGFVGVQRRLLGAEGKGLFAENDTERGYLKEVLQPGIYYINTKEIEVIPTEVGIFQTTFAESAGPRGKKPITFTSRGGFPISVDCTVEWEVLPQDMPKLVAEYGSRRRVEENVIDLQTHAIGRDKGTDYGVQDLLEGTRRQKFQEDFTKELIATCKEKNVTVHSAFIRNIVIPETYLKQIRDKQIAIQKTETNKAKEATAKTHAQVQEAKETVEQEVKKVEAETKRMVAVVDNQVENLKKTTEAELDRMREANKAEIAILMVEREKILGEAEAEAKKLKETAKASLFQLKMEAFRNDSTAYLRYSLAEKLNPQLKLKLYHAGPGTFWTNMEGSKGMNLMLSPTTEPNKSAPKAE